MTWKTYCNEGHVKNSIRLGIMMAIPLHTFSPDCSRETVTLMFLIHSYSDMLALHASTAEHPVTSLGKLC